MPHVGADVLVTASEQDPTQVHVYRVGDAPLRLSTEDGVHSATRGGDVRVLTSWALDRSDQRVRVLRGDEQVAEVTSYAVTPPIEPNLRLLTVGERRLRAALLLPTGYQPGDGPLPVLLDPYGGPRAQRVLASRNAFLASQWLADQGFAVLIADGRGTPGRGPAWDREIAFDFAGITLADQVDALHAVAADHPELDLSRVAIRGWSYGGYLSALAVLRRPDVFHAAIAGAPVTDWRLYDTHYTERYLGHPDERPEVYQRNSLIDDAPNLTRPLLIIHGLADDNVVVAHLLNPSRPQPAGGTQSECRTGAKPTCRNHRLPLVPPTALGCRWSVRVGIYGAQSGVRLAESLAGAGDGSPVLRSCSASHRAWSSGKSSTQASTVSSSWRPGCRTGRGAHRRRVRRQRRRGDQLIRWR